MNTNLYWEPDPLYPSVPYSPVYFPYAVNICTCDACKKAREPKVNVDINVNLDAKKFHEQIDKVLAKLERAKLLKKEVFGP